MEVKTWRPYTGGNPSLITPILSYNASWLNSNISVLFSDNVFHIKNISSSDIIVVYTMTYDIPDPYTNYI